MRRGFRDGLQELFPRENRARRLGEQVLTLSEFLEREASDFELPKLSRHVVVHGHCHRKAIHEFDDELALFERIGLQVEIPEAGCCGMAGSFGFESEKYDVSVACGERALLPCVRESAEDTIIIANGFSCREQISQGSGRHALHLAESWIMRSVGSRRTRNGVSDSVYVRNTRKPLYGPSRHSAHLL